jgi:hypothetical protein
MKKLFLLGLSAVTLFAASCKNEKNPQPEPDNKDVVEISGDITENQTWEADKQYKLKGFVYVTNGATLTIQPGTVIYGDKSSKSTLIITRGAKIMAEGTPTQPIVFTSGLEAGARAQGDWGGIILLGNAPVNPTGGKAKIEGGLTPTRSEAEEQYVWYGGSNEADNSGILKYVRIEFAGVAFTPDNEINGLTLAGVGSGTTISYVQVYRSGDDAFEWFGGTVNCDHLVATYTWDDDFDTDFGYSGKVQFGLIHRAKTIADVSGSNGFESDNDGNGSINTPQTSAVFSNITVVGPIQGRSTSGINNNYQHAAQIRRNASISIHNSILMGFPIGLYIDDTRGEPTSGNVVAGKLNFAHNIIAGCPTELKHSGTGFDIAAWVSANGNTLVDSTQHVLLADPYKYSSAVASTTGRPDFRLKEGSPALTGASFTGLTGFTPVAYKGAFDGSNDWTADWTTWEAELTDYANR